MIYNVVLISTVEQSDPIAHIYILYFIIFHYGLSQVVEYNYLCYRVGPGCLSIHSMLRVVVCICQFQTLTPASLTSPAPWQLSLLSISASLFLSHRLSSFVIF